MVEILEKHFSVSLLGEGKEDRLVKAVKSYFTIILEYKEHTKIISACIKNISRISYWLEK